MMQNTLNNIKSKVENKNRTVLLCTANKKKEFISQSLMTKKLGKLKS